MAVIDAKEGALGPLLVLVVLRLRLHNVKDDGDTVLVVVSHNTLIGVGAVTSHESIPLV